MKKSILLLLLMVAINVGAQKYVLFPTDNAEWNIRYSTAPEYFQQAISTTLLKYKLHGDTIINSKTYKKVYGGSQVNICSSCLLKISI